MPACFSLLALYISSYWIWTERAVRNNLGCAWRWSEEAGHANGYHTLCDSFSRSTVYKNKWETDMSKATWTVQHSTREKAASKLSSQNTPLTGWVTVTLHAELKTKKGFELATKAGKAEVGLKHQGFSLSNSPVKVQHDFNRLNKLTVD